MPLRPHTPHRLITAFAAVGALGVGLASAQPDPSGIDFVTVGAVGNSPWAGDGTPGDRAVGRGGVNYEYRIGRYEVTTSQWVEFFNAAMDRPSNDRLPHVQAPTFWGAIGATPTHQGGRRWTVPAGNEMLPTGNISWRMAAMYCNWLHNDKRSDRAAFMNGAYDVSTFGYFGDIFTDQLSHNVDAKYWIPTWDEWLKSAHYDPAKQNPDGTTGGWWAFSNGTDIRLTGAPPSLGGQANFGWNEFDYPGFSPFGIPLGSYSQTQSPWGLFDVSGQTREWTEGVLTGSDGDRYRIVDGSRWDRPPGTWTSDRINTLGADLPSLPFYEYGFRIASIPSTGPACVLVIGLVVCCQSRNRRRDNAQPDPTGGFVLLSQRRGGTHRDLTASPATC